MGIQFYYFKMVDLESVAVFLTDYNMAVLGILTVICIGVAYLFETYMPLVDPKPPKITPEDDPNLKKSSEELQALEERQKDLPMMTLKELEKCSGRPGEKAYVCNKGKIYDCSANEVYRSDGGY